MNVYGGFLPLDPNIGDPGYRNGSSQGIYGARVATKQFLKNLLRYGDFEAYHFFNPGRYKPQEAGEVEAYFGLLEPDPRIKLLKLEDFGKAVQETNYLVFHSPQGPDIAQMLYLRNQISRQNIPITGVTHTISYQFQLVNFLTLPLIGAQQWDSIVCLEVPAVKVMKNHFSHLQNRLFQQFGFNLEYKGRLDSIPLGVDTQTYRPREKQALRQHFGLPNDKVILLWIGRFSHYDKMDLQPLLIAFKKALEKCSEDRAVLVLAGDDSRYDYAEKVTAYATQLDIQEQVIILKNRPRIDFPLLYSAADVFVSPSDNVQETFGQTVLEGMSSGLPVVCSDWEGYSISVIHGRTGFRVPTYWMECDETICDYAPFLPFRLNHLYLSQSVCVDVEQMSEVLLFLILHDDLRSKMGRQARQHVLDTYDWKIIIGRYMELWEELHKIASHHALPLQQSSWFRPAYFQTFQHYATMTLQPTTRVRKTPLILTSTGSNAPPWYEEMDVKLQPEIIDAILSHSTDWIAVAELEANLCTIIQTTPEVFRYHLLYLLKYHCLSFDVDTLEKAATDLRNLNVEGHREGECQ
ncbi:MAG: glycosyltransferase family 4 protein [Candidatus Poribacteria bacterium]|nr:glycosyltransferase family 4 protein [Candidatus Poribacteria bacterium]